MSMISSQVDALRRAAQNYRDFGKYEAEQMLLDAADTIWQLRDDLQRMNAENAKLRELCADLYAGMLAYSKVQPTTQSYWATRLGELGVEVDG